MKVRKNCEKYERTVDYFIAATFQIFTALQDKKKKKKKRKRKSSRTTWRGWRDWWNRLHLLSELK